MKDEIHLFILWPHAMEKSDGIFADIQRKFETLDAFVVRWSDQHFSNNLSRFYGTNLPNHSFKEVHCGRGPFCLLVVRDPDPNYAVRETSAGMRRVNVNVFDAKQYYRSLTGGGHRIHATNSVAETDHDLMLLLEREARNYRSRTRSDWDGQVKLVERDLPGADGWRSIEQLFKVTNATIPYVVLRNFEGLPQKYSLEHHGDIDVLCTDLPNMRYIANGRPVFKEKCRVLHAVRIAHRDVLFDFRYEGDGYYDRRWEQDIINRRIYSDKGFYQPCRTDYFFSLLYHALVHKASVSTDYVDRLCTLSQGLVDLSPQDFSDLQKLTSLLSAFMSERGYVFTEPSDLSVHLNTKTTGWMKLSLDRILSSSRSVGDALHRLFEQTADRSVESSEFDQPVYRADTRLRRHFSLRRVEFISSLPLEGVHSVLEIGAESGVLTRYLGQRFTRVVAVEDDPDFAKAAKARCCDLQSVTVHRIAAVFSMPLQSFDLIIFTCDCEAWIRSGKTLRAMRKTLEHSMRLAAPTAIYLLSVDNALTGAGFFGAAAFVLEAVDPKHELIEGLNADDLAALFREAAFNEVTRLYFFPNHLVPDAIFTEEAVQRRLRAFGYWAGSVSKSRTSSGDNLLANAEMSRAGRLPEMAGGIGLFATRYTTGSANRMWQVLSFSSDDRPRTTRTVTKIAAGDNLTVIKEGEEIHCELFTFKPQIQSPLIEGHLVDAALLAAVKSGRRDQLIRLLRKIGTFLKSSFAWEDSTNFAPRLTAYDDVNLTGRALEAIPRNMILQNGTLQVFDLEWQALIPLPLSYILFRSVSYLDSMMKPEKIIRCLGSHRTANVDSFDKAVMHLINQTNLFSPIAHDMAAVFRQFDRRFFSFAFNGESSKETPSLMELYQKATACLVWKDYCGLQDAVSNLKRLYLWRPEVHRLLSFLQSMRVLPTSV